MVHVLAMIVLGCISGTFQQEDLTMAPTKVPHTGLYTVDYIIIGVASAAAAGSTALIIFACISSRRENKQKSKIQPVSEQANIIQKSAPVNEGYESDELYPTPTAVMSENVS